jgi:hypothetical protein
MLPIDPKDYVLLYSGAMIAIGFTFFASFFIEMILRKQELEIASGKLTPEKALEETTKLFWRTAKGLILLIFIAILAFIYYFYFAPTPPSVLNNVTNLYENCSYPIVNTANYYNVTIIENVNKTFPSVSIEEMKNLMHNRN